MIKVLNMSTNLFLLVILWSFFNEYLWSVWNLFLCKEYDKDTVSFYHEATWPWISSSLLSFLFHSQLCSIRWSAQTRHIVHYLFNWSNPWWLRWQKNLPVMKETWVPLLGWEDCLEKGMATPSSILAWRIPWTEEPDRLQSMWMQRVGHDWASNTVNSTSMKWKKAVCEWWVNLHRKKDIGNSERRQGCNCVWGTPGLDWEW